MRGLKQLRWMTSAGAALLLAGAPAMPALARQAMPQAAPEAAANHAQAVADRYVAQGTLPGVVISEGWGDAAPEIHAAGHIALDPGAPAAMGDSLWRIYSMTKPVTGIAAMILIEEGKLKLDQPISDFIPAFRNMRVLVDPANSLESVPAKHPITVRNLLTHTAGLGYNIITKGPLLDEYNKLGINPAQVNAQMEPQMRGVRPATLAEFADRVATLPLIAEPGTKWSYSIGLDVLGRVIEVASGMPFDQFLQTRIFTPLRMDSTYFTVPASAEPRLATNYAIVGERLVPVDTGADSIWLTPPSFPYGGAGLVSSAEDYDRFLLMLLDGGELDGVRILKPETVRLALSNLLPAGVDSTLLDAMAANGTHMGFGAGGSVYLVDKPGGPGKGTYGWAGAAGTLGFVDPVHRLRGVVMVNYFGHLTVREDATRAIYEDLH